MDELRFLIETYLDYQKDRVRLQNRLRSLPADVRGQSFLGELLATAFHLERRTKSRIEQQVESDPLYSEYLKYQKGIGKLLAGYLIGWLARERDFKIFGIVEKIGERTYKRKYRKKIVTLELPPYAKVLEENLKGKPKYIRVWMPPVMKVAENPSDLHKYCGVVPQSRKKKGEQVDFNPRVKTLMWKIFRQFVMSRSGGEWTRIYKVDKKAYAERCPEPEKGSKKLKVYFTTKNIVMRKFLTNLWLVYRWQHNLPTTEPYPAKLGHTILKPFIETEDGIKYLRPEDFYPKA